MCKQKPDVFRIPIQKYTYVLPEERIAAYPLPRRDSSKLLICRENRTHDAMFTDLHDHLPPGALMVFNNTRVVQARLEFYKETGARIEIFCLHPKEPSIDVHIALGSSSPSRWYCLVGNAKKWKSGPLVIRHPGNEYELTAVNAGRMEDGYLIDFHWKPAGLSFAEILEAIGKTPLPPYITREAETGDKTTYQTVFARYEGSVAAPTAGLHFTDHVFDNLKKRGITKEFVTLHVGAGTFKPVTSETIGQHAMHAEQFSVHYDVIHKLKEQNEAVVAVGTTGMRTLESLYWLGLQLKEERPAEARPLFLPQWFPYRYKHDLPAKKEALEELLRWMDRHKTERLQGETALIIVPGYPFRVTDALVTNFHQPGSTLLLLVAAFAGDAWKNVYQHAIDNHYRFLSYGDSCLFFKENQ